MKSAGIININNPPSSPAVTAGTVQAVVANFNAITQPKITKPQPQHNHLMPDFPPYGSVGRSFSAHQMSTKQLSPKSPTISQPDFFIRPSPTRNSTDHGRSSLRMTMLPGGGGSRNSEDYLKVWIDYCFPNSVERNRLSF
jgi:hypothetical protein